MLDFRGLLDKVDNAPLSIKLFVLMVMALPGAFADVYATKNPKKRLAYWAKEGSIEKVEELLKRLPWSFYVDERDAAGMTPLMHAAQAGHIAIVRLLLRKGADVSRTDSGGISAMKLAEQSRHFAIVELLKEAGARR